jgi:exodeoxyribonuclease-5
MITLTDEQNKAIHLIKKWFSTSDCYNPFILAGLAGTGKTTIIKHITDELNIKDFQIRYCAFTGKASMVMRSKGMQASTIHSLIYEPITDPETKKVMFRKKDSLGCDVLNLLKSLFCMLEITANFLRCRAIQQI